MDAPSLAALADASAPKTKNPHILWRQIVGLILWVALLSFLGGPIHMALSFALAGAIFADAWKSGIYKLPDKKSFLNISPMGWGIVVAGLFVVGYPIYLLKRNALRTKQSTNWYFWAAVVLGMVVVIRVVLGNIGPRA